MSSLLVNSSSNKNETFKENLISLNFGKKYFKIVKMSTQMKRKFGKKKSQRMSMKTLMRTGSQEKMGFDIQRDSASMKKMFLE